jgi:tRNA threonylcarbamoyladenosine biosynthesis protein TsaE
LSCSGSFSSVGSFLFIAASLDETARLARACAARSFPGLVILLEGDLGVGKTQFVRFFAEYFGRCGVRSPSFTLVNEYKGDPLLVHADLYRISSGDPVLRDLEEILQAGAILLVEWADRWTDVAGEEQWHLAFTFDESGGGSDEESELFSARRCIRCTALGERARRSLEEVREDMGISGTNAGRDNSETNISGTDGSERCGFLSGEGDSNTNGPGRTLCGTRIGARIGTSVEHGLEKEAKGHEPGSGH